MCIVGIVSCIANTLIVGVLWYDDLFFLSAYIYFDGFVVYSVVVSCNSIQLLPVSLGFVGNQLQLCERDTLLWLPCITHIHPQYYAWIVETRDLYYWSFSIISQTALKKGVNVCMHDPLCNTRSICTVDMLSYVGKLVVRFNGYGLHVYCRFNFIHGTHILWA